MALSASRPNRRLKTTAALAQDGAPPLPETRFQRAETGASAGCFPAPRGFPLFNIPRIPRLLGAILRLSEAHRNEIRSKSTRCQPKRQDARPRRAETRA
jgi:hypothetical protein